MDFEKIKEKLTNSFKKSANDATDNDDDFETFMSDYLDWNINNFNYEELEFLKFAFSNAKNWDFVEENFRNITNPIIPSIIENNVDKKINKDDQSIVRELDRENPKDNIVLEDKSTIYQIIDNNAVIEIEFLTESVFSKLKCFFFRIIFNN
jgi:hypothetical protein